MSLADGMAYEKENPPVSKSDSHEDEFVTTTFHELPSKAMRFNTGKPQLSYMLEADVAMKGMCAAFEFGAKKYARGNWKSGLNPNEIVDSLLRHLMSYQNGEVLDLESGLPHIDHITCNAVFLATFGNRGGGKAQQQKDSVDLRELAKLPPLELHAKIVGMIAGEEDGPDSTSP